MNPINLVTDPYDRQARLYPGLVLLAPVIITVAIVLGPKFTPSNGLLATFAAFGGLFFLSQFARGRQKEPSLYKAWGGMPSVAIFRHSDTRIDPYTKARYHQTLAGAVQGTHAPSTQEESADPAATDDIYRAWSSFLRNATRDKKIHSLVFTENVNYGYRRNLWAMKPIGIAFCSLIVFGCVWQAVWWLRRGSAIPEECYQAGGVAIVFLLLWVFKFSTGWVKSAADAYAERLADSVDLVTKGGSSPAAKKAAKKASKTATKKKAKDD